MLKSADADRYDVQVCQTEPLAETLSRRVLSRFGCSQKAPVDLATLQLLIDRYTRLVPWESYSRLVRRARHSRDEDCAVLGAAFWENALNYSSGGTCFESNYAFFSLLLSLGYEGYLTINNMGNQIGCHTAIVIILDGEKHLVDVGLPIYAVLPIRAGTTTRAKSRFFGYTVEPLADSRYDIWRDPHPNRNAFTLIDQPIADADYRLASVADYQPGSGYFLDKVVINKVIDGNLWRFNSADPPLRIEVFVSGQKHEIPLTTDPANQLAARFEADRDLIAEALEIVGAKSEN